MESEGAKPPTRLGVGIVGCGQATQALHLPALASLGDHFRVAHLVDASPAVAHGLAERLAARGGTDLDALLADPAVDVVLVATPDHYHARHAVAACRARKKAVLVEKPLALTPGEARAVVRVSAETGVPVQVGTMHRYDPAFRAVEEQLRELRPQLVVAQTFYGLNDFWRADQVELLKGPPAVPDAELPLSWLNTAVLHAGLDAEGRFITATILGVALSCHDMTLLRATLGEPDAVEHVTLIHGIGYEVVLRYGSTTAVLLVHENGGRFQDWKLRWLGRDVQIELTFPQSWGASSPATAEVHRTEGGLLRTERFGSRFETGFRAEWRHLHAVATEGVAPLTPATDAAADVALVERIVSQAAQRPAKEPGALGVALLGAGWITAIHGPILSALASSRVPAVASRTLRSAEHRAWALDAEACTFDAMPGLLAREDVHAVVVAGPPAVHAEHVIAALEAGKHAIVEKPLARTLAEADAIVAAEAGSRGAVAYAENYAFIGQIAEAARLVRSGAIGDLRSGGSVSMLHGPPAWGDFLRPSWGGGCLFDLAPHALWWLLELHAWPVVESVTTRVLEGNPAEGDRHVELELRFASDLCATVVASWRHAGPMASHAEVVGSKGTLRVGLEPRSSLALMRNGTAEPQELPWPSGPRGTVGGYLAKHGYRQQLECFVDSFRAGKAPSPGAVAGRTILELICAGYASAASGLPEPLPFRGPRDRTPYELWRVEES